MTSSHRMSLSNDEVVVGREVIMGKNVSCELGRINTNF